MVETHEAKSAGLLGLIRESLDLGKYQDEHWEGSFHDYLQLVDANPFVVRTSHQRVYDMVLSHGVEEVERNKTKMQHHRFFDDPMDEGADAIFGLDRATINLMSVLKAAAHGFGPERRVLLLHGPVGSAKSTIVRGLQPVLPARHEDQ